MFYNVTARQTSSRSPQQFVPRRCTGVQTVRLVATYTSDNGSLNEMKPPPLSVSISCDKELYRRRGQVVNVNISPLSFFASSLPVFHCSIDRRNLRISSTDVMIRFHVYKVPNLSRVGYRHKPTSPTACYRNHLRKPPALVTGAAGF